MHACVHFIANPQRPSLIPPLLRLLLIHLPDDLFLLIRNLLIDLRAPTWLIPMHLRRRRGVDLACTCLCRFCLA